MRKLDGSSSMVATGRLRADSVEDFRDRVDQALRAGRTRLLVDVGNAGPVDSTGLGALLWAAASAHRRGCELLLVNVDENLTLQLKHAGLTRSLPTISGHTSEARQGPGQ